MNSISDVTKVNLKPKDNFTNLVRNNGHFILVVLMIFSYFYNLPVAGYSLKGDNELRLYDFLGIIVLFVFFSNWKFYYVIIHKVTSFKWLYRFLIWCSLTILVTFIFSVFKDRINSFLQSILYLFHFWTFFATSMMAYVISFNKTKLKIFIYTVLISSILCSLIIAFQNFGIIPFLWNDNYFKSYRGFLSGTLGPNKIVTGMFSLMSVIFAIGIFFNKKVHISKIIVLIVVLTNLYVLLLSGSRTSYLGLLVFIAFFSFV